MKPLASPDSLHLQAAQGWLELGNHLEANDELEKITAKLRVHPDVLKVRWQIYQKAKKLDGMKDISTALTTLLPFDPEAWRIHANSFYFAGEYQQAHDIAKLKVIEFKDDWKLHYDLACYCSRLGKIAEARDALEKAIEIGEPSEVKLMALGDPDLEPLWKRIGEL